MRAIGSNLIAYARIAGEGKNSRQTRIARLGASQGLLGAPWERLEKPRESRQKPEKASFCRLFCLFSLLLEPRSPVDKNVNKINSLIGPFGEKQGYANLCESPIMPFVMDSACRTLGCGELPCGAAIG